MKYLSTWRSFLPRDSSRRYHHKSSLSWRIMKTSGILLKEVRHSTSPGTSCGQRSPEARPPESSRSLCRVLVIWGSFLCLISLYTLWIVGRIKITTLFNASPCRESAGSLVLQNLVQPHRGHSSFTPLRKRGVRPTGLRALGRIREPTACFTLMGSRTVESGQLEQKELSPSHKASEGGKERANGNFFRNIGIADKESVL